MTFTHGKLTAPGLAFIFLAAPVPTLADTVIANCTGMLNFDVYTIDTERPRQEIDGIGEAEVTMDEDFIYLDGSFGEYRFDLKAGTLYHNDSDTSVYCTYKWVDD